MSRLDDLPHREVQSETSLEVDLLILDFLAYEATQALIDEIKCSESTTDSEQSAASKANLYTSFVHIFKCRHPNDDAVPADIQLRTLIAKFALLHLQRRFSYCSFARDYDERAASQRRAQVWWAQAGADTSMHPQWLSELPLPTEVRRRARLAMIKQLGLKQPPNFLSSSCPNLMDSLPVFMLLTAAVQDKLGRQGSNITNEWSAIAGEFMLQTVLEQCVRSNVTAESVSLHEIFGWGYAGQSGARNTIDDLFMDHDTGEEVQVWANTKRKVLNILQPPSATTFASHLEDLVDMRILPKFEGAILGFIETLCNLQEKPLLLQVEMGQVSNMPPAAVDALKRMVRWPVQKED